MQEVQKSGSQTRTVNADLPSIAARLDRLPITRLHFLLLFICTLGFAFDQVEIAIASALSAVFSAAPQSANPEQLAWLLSSMFIGAIVGAPAFGWLGDRWGRRRTLVLVLTVLAATSAFAALSANIGMLTIARGLSGMAIGAFPPLVIAYLTDILPARRRGRLIFQVGAISSLAQVGIIFFVRWLTPLQPLGIDAWRWAFYLGTVGSIGSALLFLLLPESPRWLASRGRLDEANAVLNRFERSQPLGASKSPIAIMPSAPPVRPTLPEGSLRKRLAIVLSLFFLSPWSTVAFPLLSGVVLIERGFKLSDSLFYVGISLFGPVIGTLIVSLFVDRIERRVALIGSAALMLLSGIAFVTSLSPIWLMASGVAFTLFVSIYIPTLTLYTAEMFDTANRGRATSGGWAMNRLGAALGPFVLIPLLHSAGVPTMSIIVGITLVAGLLLVILVAPGGRAGYTVD